MWTRSATILPITSRDAPSSAVTGFSVFGSVRSATVRRPEYWPTEFEVTRTSSPFESGSGPAAEAKTASARTSAIASATRVASGRRCLARENMGAIMQFIGGKGIQPGAREQREEG